MYAPTMPMAPWAKFTTPDPRYTITIPTAERAYTAPAPSPMMAKRKYSTSARPPSIPTGPGRTGYPSFTLTPWSPRRSRPQALEGPGPEVLSDGDLRRHRGALVSLPGRGPLLQERHHSLHRVRMRAQPPDHLGLENHRPVPVQLLQVAIHRVLDHPHRDGGGVAGQVVGQLERGGGELLTRQGPRDQADRRRLRPGEDAPGEEELHRPGEPDEPGQQPGAVGLGEEPPPAEHEPELGALGGVEDGEEQGHRQPRSHRGAVDRPDDRRRPPPPGPRGTRGP